MIQYNQKRKGDKKMKIRDILEAMGMSKEEVEEVMEELMERG